MRGKQVTQAPIPAPAVSLHLARGSSEDSNIMESGVILTVDDDPDMAFLEHRSLERAGYAVSIASSTREARRVVERGGVRLIVLDQRLPGGLTGLDFHAQLKELGHALPVIMVSGHYSEATVIKALHAGTRDFVSKSIENLDYLPEAVGRVLDRIRTERLLEESEQRYKSLFEYNADAVYSLDLDGKFLSVDATGWRA